MKSILLSIQPKWIAKILNGEKTIEVRKRFPKEYKGWVYIYCTKGYDGDTPIIMWERPNKFGKVVARFYCDKVERFDVPYPAYFHEVKDKLEHITNESCLSLMELHHYLRNENGYAIHISQLEIFDKPKELNEFKQEWYDCGNNFHSKPLTKAPQPYMFIEVEE